MTDAPYGQPPTGYGPPPADGLTYPGAAVLPGRTRGTGFGILLFFVTFGIYGYYWYFVVHDEMKRHSGQGLGGGIALLLAFVVGVASPFLTSNEVGALYERAGQAKPVTGWTGLWVFPGIFLLFLPIVWFVKTNGAINAYWRAHGAV